MATSSVPVTVPAPAPAFPQYEKPVLPGYLAPISPLANAWSRFSYWRTALALPNPGTAEGLQKEVKSASRASCHVNGHRLFTQTPT
jgi:mitochondrial import receptor subunit TOM40